VQPGFLGFFLFCFSRVTRSLLFQELFAGLPAHLTLSEQQLQDFKYLFAEHMTKGALTRKSVVLAKIYRQRGVQLVIDAEVDEYVFLKF
jgi:hypothetical protein